MEKASSIEILKRAVVEMPPGEDFADMFEKEWAKDPSLTGKMKKGKVVALVGNVAMVDVGLKSEGAVQLAEFGAAKPKIGEEVEVYIESFDGRSGVVLSLERAKRIRMWKKLEELQSEAKTTKGRIVGRIKGGFNVSLDGTIAFLPGSHLDIRPVRDPRDLMEMELEFSIIKMDKQRDSIVVSRRAVLENINSGSRSRLLENMKEGDDVEGVVRSLTDYGAFVDLGGIDGLLHITDMSWGRISGPSEAVKIGQKLTLKVKSYDREKAHIGLSLKEFIKDPWQGDIAEKYKVGERFKGRVCHITDYGAFVEVESGVKGLVHVSEMNWSRRTVSPESIVSLSEEVEVEVLGVEPEKRRISLGMKQCLPNPWKEFASKHKPGDKIKGLVRKTKSAKVQNFFLLDLGQGMDGMVHASDLDWELHPAEAIKKYKSGDNIETVILDIDADNERVSLGVKQLKNDPFAGLANKVKKGDLYTCTVKSIDGGGLLVETQDGLVGLVPSAEMSGDREITSRNFSAGERVDAQVIRVDKNSRRLIMSIKAREKKEEKEAMKKYGSTESGATLGDILGQAIESKEAEGSGGEKKAEEKKAAKDSESEPSADPSVAPGQKPEKEAKSQREAKEEPKEAELKNEPAGQEKGAIKPQDG